MRESTAGWGELIGKAVIRAVKEALRLQTGLSPETQHHVLRRTDRFGITEQTLWEAFREKTDVLSRAEFSDRLYSLCRRDEMVTAVSLYVHLMDQLLWGLLTPEEALSAGGRLLQIMREPDSEQKSAGTENCAGRETAFSRMIQQLKNLLNDLISDRKK